MKIALIATAAVVLGGTAMAGETVTALAKEGPAAPVLMTEAEMDGIVAGNHVIRLVQFRSGDTLPTTAAVDATTRAGSIDGAGNDRPAIVALLP